MLKAQLTEEMKTAMKARDMDRLGVIRMMLAAIKNVEIDKGELDDDGAIAVLKSERKKMKDAIDQFESAGRDELVEQETAKVKVIEEFLPEEMGKEEIEKVVNLTFQLYNATDTCTFNLLGPSISTTTTKGGETLPETGAVENTILLLGGGILTVLAGLKLSKSFNKA